ncbi:MAG: ATP-binding cassette domain-containing protein [Actinomycetota bacterium]
MFSETTPSGSVVLELVGVTVEVGDVEVLHEVDLTIRSGELHVLFGRNGSGKSSLLAAVMGLHPYRVTSGQIRLFGESLEDVTVSERAQRGIGMAFQDPPDLEGVSVDALANALESSDRLPDAETALHLDGFRDRPVNVGFSGGEKKRWEICKLFLRRPRLLLLDEPEGGVDLEHAAVIGDAIASLLEPGATDDGTVPAGLVVSHTGSILDRLPAHTGHLLVDGRLVHSGDAGELFDHIRRDGYRAPA